MEEEIQTLLKPIKAKLKEDGGDVDLLGIQAGRAQLRLKGACAECPYAESRLHRALKALLLNKRSVLKGLDFVESP